jgi:hypothetical protein
VRYQRTVGKRALRGDISFRDRPTLMSHRVHLMAFFCRRSRQRRRRDFLSCLSGTFRRRRA